VDSDCFIIHQLEKKYTESDSNFIVSLCRYDYSCGVNPAILLYLELLSELDFYHYSYRLWCEQAFRVSILVWLRVSCMDVCYCYSKCYL